MWGGSVLVVRDGGVVGVVLVVGWGVFQSTSTGAPGAESPLRSRGRGRDPALGSPGESADGDGPGKRANQQMEMVLGVVDGGIFTNCSVAVEIRDVVVDDAESSLESVVMVVVPMGLFISIANSPHWDHKMDYL